ncbi:holo-ACP synthase [Cytobacillus purgationiresistens]|uniref:Holo-[acyl-carrier-protein] synthase n=1 Tax=Cytobacillus purgationiresistens TaxID=863449 RepID=A0ABU0APJ3_9BACI|nr:holo-ACP synthase [Cytobacillus purgationiresistens]MDQ0273211.1 holo-[acyl-carrier protein] synthase [Cytobacillus purgationiresistens]
MIIGIGIDITELSRIQKMAAYKEKFAARILTDKEQEIYQSLSERRRVEYLAGRFAAKEAFSKAYGTGISKDLSFHDIEITSDHKGKPFIIKPFKEGVHLSISHSREYAAAQVVIEKID